MVLRGPVFVIVLLVQAGFTSVDWLPHRQDAKGILLLRSVSGYRLTTRWNKPGGFLGVYTAASNESTECEPTL
jgi:hypothetical protein